MQRHANRALHERNSLFRRTFLEELRTSTADASTAAPPGTFLLRMIW
jgi:hypothetical protein